MLYIMRHGKTEWNELHKLQGRTDLPLNEEGRQMAKIAGEKYKDINFDVCYCSPLVRAKETAKLVLEGRNVPIIYDERLREMSFGIYEGMENPAKATDSPIRTFFKEPEKYKGVKEGETFYELFKRTGEFLKEVVMPDLNEGKDVLIVEDIIDSGRTLSYLIEVLKQRNPKNIELCTLLDKPERRVKKQVKVDYTCFTIPDEFVVGYGLDYDQKYRNLPYIGVVEQDQEETQE